VERETTGYYSAVDAASFSRHAYQYRPHRPHPPRLNGNLVLISRPDQQQGVQGRRKVRGATFIPWTDSGWKPWPAMNW